MRIKRVVQTGAKSQLGGLKPIRWVKRGFI